MIFVDTNVVMYAASDSICRRRGVGEIMTFEPDPADSYRRRLK